MYIDCVWCVLLSLHIIWLMHTNRCSPYFIRCIKPNSDKVCDNKPCIYCNGHVQEFLTLVSQPHLTPFPLPSYPNHITSHIQLPGCFNERLVMHQLRCLGVMETVHIRRLGFPIRVKFDSFLERFVLTNANAG